MTQEIEITQNRRPSNADIRNELGVPGNFQIKSWATEKTESVDEENRPELKKYTISVTW